MQHLVDGAIAISANHTSAYAVLADGTLLAADWSNWQLHPVLQNVVAVSAGYAHTMALTSDGTLYATGENSFGLQGVKNLAVGRSSDRWRVSMKKVVRFTANLDHSMALTKDGSLWLVGRINGGSAGHTTEQVWPQWTQIPAPAGTIVDLVPGYYYPTVRLADGTLVSPTIDAGNVNAGGLFLAPLTQVADASSVYDSGWLLKKDGSLWAAGNNVQGTWFSGGTVLGYTPTWTRIATGVAIGSP
jgi:alpha-tubulin suppressor-like RCC1 family protein